MTTVIFLACFFAIGVEEELCDQNKKEKSTFVFEWLYFIYKYKLKIGHGSITNIFKVSFERLWRRKLFPVRRAMNNVISH